MNTAAVPARQWQPLVALVALTLIWGYTWVLMKQGLSYAPPFSFVAERCVGGALALLLALKLSGRSLRLTLPGKTLRIGLVQVAGFTLFQT